ncbi:hypothetical protein A1O1_01463 [Capronia coronata CBS 617.96]|uniref:Uncharacterized protein n=1 Tax=Capronia coronata CBS 617.96 TaxID=1182541 RepID=W9YTY9_9EURO|nr:uncharacterized protein A1O1_01463 [Capronia coronata CBS 617.96]EXJ96337.1 hypothetical protein A1O1_01463 [Capronia coronata CBS 617.96]
MRLLACLSWLLTHRILMNKGFILRRKGLSTDTIASLVIGLTATAWTSSVLVHLYNTETRWEPSQQQSWEQGTVLRTLAGLADAPLLTQNLFGFWLVSWPDGIRAERNRNDGYKPYLWSLAGLRGPFDWASGIHSGFYRALVVVIAVSVSVPAIAAVLVGNPLTGILNLAGLVLFLVNGVGNNPYVRASHRYASDRLRIALPTSHHEGTTYILPSRGTGIDAVWTPKIQNEHLEADQEMMTLFAKMRSGRCSVGEPLEHLRKCLALYHPRALLSTSEVQLLASWIYAEKAPGDPSLRTIHCDRAPGVHLVGRDLMFALCHAEYIVFMEQGRLPAVTRDKLGTLRLLSRSGAGVNSETDTHTIGFRPGMAGYKEAVQHIYAIFDMAVEDHAMQFSSTPPPPYSYALHSSPSTIEEYVSQLWDVSTQNSESTFSALYFFTTVWFMELGNLNGFHIFPLRCKTRDGDLVSQQIAWRQAWYSGCIAQLVAVSPMLFGLFVVGFVN